MFFDYGPDAAVHALRRGRPRRPRRPPGRHRPARAPSAPRHGHHRQLLDPHGPAAGGRPGRGQAGPAQDHVRQRRCRPASASSPGTAPAARCGGSRPTRVTCTTRSTRGRRATRSSSTSAASPSPRPRATRSGPLAKMLSYLRLDAHLYRYRFNLRTGATTEAYLDDDNTEFPTMDARKLGTPTRYAYNMRISDEPTLLFDGIVKYDTQTGRDRPPLVRARAGGGARPRSRPGPAARPRTTAGSCRSCTTRPSSAPRSSCSTRRTWPPGPSPAVLLPGARAHRLPRHLGAGRPAHDTAVSWSGFGAQRRPQRGRGARSALLVVWRIGVRMRDMSIIDIFWGPGFVLVALVTLAIGEAPLGRRLLLACSSACGVCASGSTWPAATSATARTPATRPCAATWATASTAGPSCTSSACRGSCSPSSRCLCSSAATSRATPCWAPQVVAGVGGVGHRPRLRGHRRRPAGPVQGRPQQRRQGDGPRPVGLDPPPQLLRRRLRVVGRLAHDPRAPGRAASAPSAPRS